MLVDFEIILFGEIVIIGTARENFTIPINSSPKETNSLFNFNSANLLAFLLSFTAKAAKQILK